MADKSKIEWTDATWNPVRGCSRVSEGCRHCYAETIAKRFSGPGLAYEGLTTLGKWNGQIQFVEKHLLDPLRMKEPKRIFVNSMSDLFHENVTDEMLDRIFAVMALCPQHTFQILTKRPERMLVYLSDPACQGRIALTMNTMPLRVIRMSILEDGDTLMMPLRNVHLGVSVESDKHRDRIDTLLKTPAAVRFLSCEPLIAAVSLRWLCGWSKVHPRHLYPKPNTEGRVCTDEFDGLRELDWVICGGESGPGARPMHPDWARSLRDQCVDAGVPFFFKQWGEWTPGVNVTGTKGKVRGADWFDGKWLYSAEDLAEDEGHIDDERTVYRVGKKAAGDLLDGVQWHQFPAVGVTA